VTGADGNNREAHPAPVGRPAHPNSRARERCQLTDFCPVAACDVQLPVRRIDHLLTIRGPGRRTDLGTKTTQPPCGAPQQRRCPKLTKRLVSKPLAQQPFLTVWRNVHQLGIPYWQGQSDRFTSFHGYLASLPAARAGIEKHPRAIGEQGPALWPAIVGDPDRSRYARGWKRPREPEQSRNSTRDGRACQCPPFQPALTLWRSRRLQRARRWLKGERKVGGGLESAGGLFLQATTHNSI
jgi:hypothetical protein